ncbi:MAG: hypothetical protein M5U34_40740 [Chloroflexi bacterium]|nr:hypothetical protein [Chloroflexota bacterium]
MVSLYAYFLRPVLEPIRYYTSWPAGNQVPQLNGQNWLRMGWYLTPLGLVLATAGLAWIIVTQSWFRYGLFLSVGILTIVQYVYRIFNTPYHIYAMRRYVPIVIPMLMIYAAVAILVVFRARQFKAARVTGTLLALILIAGLLFQARFVLPQQDFKGAIAQLTELNALLDPGMRLLLSMNQHHQILRIDLVRHYDLSLDMILPLFGVRRMRYGRFSMISWRRQQHRNGRYNC